MDIDLTFIFSLLLQKKNIDNLCEIHYVLLLPGIDHHHHHHHSVDDDDNHTHRNPGGLALNLSLSHSVGNLIAFKNNKQKSNYRNKTKKKMFFSITQ